LRDKIGMSIRKVAMGTPAAVGKWIRAALSTGSCPKPSTAYNVSLDDCKWAFRNAEDEQAQKTILPLVSKARFTAVKVMCCGEDGCATVKKCTVKKSHMCIGM